MAHLVTEYNAHNECVIFSPTDIGVYTLTTEPYLKRRIHPQLDSYVLWTMHFDGTRSRQGTGVVVSLTDPQGKCHLVAYNL